MQRAQPERERLAHAASGEDVSARQAAEEP